MQMTGEQRIAAPRARVWAALNDTGILKQCIPGCQSLVKESDERMKATVGIKVGPIGARFAGAVTLSDIDPTNSYTITGEGQGGTAGFAKGSAKVRLADDAQDTLLRYEVDVQVGGRLAQLGGAIIDATAKQLAGSFFKKFGEVVAAAPEPAAGPAGTGPTTAPSEPADTGSAAASAQPRSTPPAPGSSISASIAWILALCVAALIGFLIGRTQGGTVSDWAGLAIGLLVIVVAAAGYLSGRRAASPTIVLDQSLLERVTTKVSENNR